jgi:hypothetical protein
MREFLLWLPSEGEFSDFGGFVGGAGNVESGRSF